MVCRHPQLIGESTHSARRGTLGDERHIRCQLSRDVHGPVHSGSEAVDVPHQDPHAVIWVPALPSTASGPSESDAMTARSPPDSMKFTAA